MPELRCKELCWCTLSALCLLLTPREPKQGKTDDIKWQIPLIRAPRDIMGGNTHWCPIIVNDYLARSRTAQVRHDPAHTARRSRSSYIEGWSHKRYRCFGRYLDAWWDRIVVFFSFWSLLIRRVPQKGFELSRRFDLFCAQHRNSISLNLIFVQKIVEVYRFCALFG